MAARFEVRPRGKQFRVYDTKDKVYITIAIPERQIADEICEDFNKMNRKDFTPIGLPDFSKRYN